jgi:hypothetical protein
LRLKDKRKGELKMKNGLTIKDATERWVHEMNAIPTGMIEKMMEADIDDWREVTLPSIGDQVYADSYGLGEVAEVISTEDGVVLVVDLDVPRSEQVEIPADEVEIERLELLPMWGTMWSFGDSADDWWLEEGNGIKIMSECGFRIYESDEFGYFFGIDGAGYDFYDAHWIPLYKARGLQWHDPVAEQEYQMLSKGYKKEKLGANTYWMDKNNNVIEEVIKDYFNFSYKEEF